MFRTIRTFPRITALAVATTAALAAPLGAQAAAPTLIAGPVAVKGYDLTMTVSRGQGARPVSLGLILTRESGGATQQHLYTFSLPASVYQANTKGARLDTGAELGRFGRIVAAFTPTSTIRGSVPDGCTGTAGKLLKGPLGGKPGVALVLDTTFFRKVAKRSVPAMLSVGGRLDCDGQGGETPGGQPPAGSTSLTGTLAGDEITTISITRGADGAVVQRAAVIEAQAATAPASIFHVISQPGPQEGFAVAAGLASATASFGGPFLGGSLGFTSSFSAGSGMATGSLAGDLVARFDSIGERVPAASGELIGVLTQS